MSGMASARKADSAGPTTLAGRATRVGFRGGFWGLDLQAGQPSATTPPTRAAPIRTSLARRLHPTGAASARGFPPEGARRLREPSCLASSLVEPYRFSGAFSRQRDTTAASASGD